MRNNVCPVRLQLYQAPRVVSSPIKENSVSQKEHGLEVLQLAKGFLIAIMGLFTTFKYCLLITNSEFGPSEYVYNWAVLFFDLPQST